MQRCSLGLYIAFLDPIFDNGHASSCSSVMGISESNFGFVTSWSHGYGIAA